MRTPTYRLLRHPPPLYALSQRLMRWNVPGAWRAYARLVAPQVADCATRIALPDGTQMWVPLTWPGLVTGRSLSQYEPQAIGFFAEQIKRSPVPVALIDCGADVGVFTRLVLAQTDNIAQIVAFEPNPMTFGLLEENLKMSGLTDAKVITRPSAVSATQGRAVLVLEPNAPHSAFITGSSDEYPGCQVVPIDVEAIDALALPSAHPIALKIDVEGEEFNVLAGARESLRRCPSFIVQFEAHPGVAKRIKADPSRCLALLNEVGATRWIAFCERTGEIVRGFTSDRPFFEQVVPTDIYDVIVVRD